MEQQAAHQFPVDSEIVEIKQDTTGNINKTYVVTLADAERFILQRINKTVFTQPELVMRNIRTFSEHVTRKLAVAPLDKGRRWETPRVMATQDGRDFWLDPEGEYWRALSFIPRSRSYNTAQSEDHAYEVGFGLGAFHNLISDLPADQLADTLPGFHIAPGYLAHFDKVVTNHKTELTAEVRYGLDFVATRRGLASVLEDAKASGKLPLRPIHGDPKINNVMMDTTTGQAISIIDLDTVKPGLVHYDIGDGLRSACNPLGEETKDFDSVCFEPELGKAILSGYLEQAHHFLTPADYEHLFDAIRLIAFELGLRFFTDHLAGDVYFTANYRGHNLERALVQFALCKSIESQESTIRKIIADAL
ncbi:aminoglycoside phosphotransferase family protein [Armatimonas sp.]|uniref:phosphotransferase enzyme family protein n=1 Tax=Armatimonas sp. TaxID=1872638 RepID=UPI00286B813B|nr:aminoglycoside phosphotransferase family protein [Armatimonas sp.]